jgi:MFS family permease
LVALLLGVEALDELYSGVPSVGSADIQSSFATSYAFTAGALLVVPGIVALLVEPILFVLADRYPRKWFVCGGLFVMGSSGLAAAAAPNAVALTVDITLAWLGSGCGVALAQATLADAHPKARERAMTRWALLGELGDLGAPLLLAGVAALGLSWRAAYAVVSVLVLSWACGLTRASFPKLASEEPAPEEPTMRVSLGAALRNRRLLLWLGASALCDLLDEVVVVFAALYLRDHFDAGPIARSVVLGMGVLGALVGVFCADALLRRVAPMRLLVVAAVTCSISFVGWLWAPTLWLSGLSFFVVGASAAPMYPIAIARAYASLPGRSGTVNAAAHLFTPLTLALPWLLGALADSVGLRVTLALLLVQPIGILLISARELRVRKKA